MRIIGSFGALLFVSGIAHGQEETPRVMDVIQITQTLSLGSEALPFDLSVLDQEDISKRLPRTIPEALRGLTGVHIQKTANGHGSPYIRGFTGNRTLALIDGIRYNNSTYRDGANEYFSHIDAGSIAGIELLRGAASILYGSEAVGGALNLKTHSAFIDDQNSSGFSGEWGANVRFASGEQSEVGRLTYNAHDEEKWGLRLGASLKSYGDVRAADLGVLPNTGYDEQAFDARFDLRLNDKWSLTALHQSLTQDDVWRTHSTFHSVSFAGTEIGSDQVRKKDQSRSLTYLRLQGQNMSDWVETASFTLSHQPRRDEEIRVRSSGAIIDEYFTSQMTGIDLNLTSFTPIGTLTYGANFYADVVESARIDISADGLTQTYSVQGPVGDDATYDQLGGFVQLDSKINDRLSIISGARYSHVSTNIGRYRNPATELADSFEDDWQNLSLGIRASYALSAARTQFIWASASQAFRAPNIADLTRFGDSRSDEIETAAIGLAPEKFETLELGWKFDNDHLRANLVGYHTDIQDYIQTTPTGFILDELVEVRKQNSSKGFIQGIDAEFGLALSPAFELSLGASWLTGELLLRDTETEISEFETISRIAPPSARLALDWQAATLPLRLGTELRVVAHANKLSSADKEDTQRIPVGGTPSYALLNVYTGYELNDKMNINLTLENVTNEAYRVHGSGSNEVGFNAIIELQARF